MNLIYICILIIIILFIILYIINKNEKFSVGSSSSQNTQVQPSDIKSLTNKQIFDIFFKYFNINLLKTDLIDYWNKRNTANIINSDIDIDKLLGKDYYDFDLRKYYNDQEFIAINYIHIVADIENKKQLDSKNGYENFYFANFMNDLLAFKSKNTDFVYENNKDFEGFVYKNNNNINKYYICRHTSKQIFNTHMAGGKINLETDQLAGASIVAFTSHEDISRYFENATMTFKKIPQGNYTYELCKLDIPKLLPFYKSFNPNLDDVLKIKNLDDILTLLLSRLIVTNRNMNTIADTDYFGTLIGPVCTSTPPSTTPSTTPPSTTPSTISTNSIINSINNSIVPFMNKKISESLIKNLYCDSGKLVLSYSDSIEIKRYAKELYRLSEHNDIDKLFIEKLQQNNQIIDEFIIKLFDVLLHIKSGVPLKPSHNVDAKDFETYPSLIQNVDDKIKTGRPIPLDKERVAMRLGSFTVSGFNKKYPQSIISSGYELDVTWARMNMPDYLTTDQIYSLYDPYTINSSKIINNGPPFTGRLFSVAGRGVCYDSTEILYIHFLGIFNKLKSSSGCYLFIIILLQLLYLEKLHSMASPDIFNNISKLKLQYNIYYNDRMLYKQSISIQNSFVRSQAVSKQGGCINALIATGQPSVNVCTMGTYFGMHLYQGVRTEYEFALADGMCKSTYEHQGAKLTLACMAGIKMLKSTPGKMPTTIYI
jgi:hypothetical protein